MKTVIAGSRHFKGDWLKLYFNRCPWDITEVVCGMCPGVDMAGFSWAENNGLEVKEFRADWEGLGRKAGPLRNIAMHEYADRALIIWDGISRGTKHTLDLFLDSGKPVCLYQMKSKNYHIKETRQ